VKGKKTHEHRIVDYSGQAFPDTSADWMDEDRSPDAAAGKIYGLGHHHVGCSGPLNRDAELVGAIGLILPMLTGVVPWLTIAAAIGMAVVMADVTVFHAARKEYREIALTLALLVVAGHVIWAPLAWVVNLITHSLSHHEKRHSTRSSLFFS